LKTKKAIATIRITDLKVRTIIGINPWERKTKQDVMINIALDVDAGRAVRSDDITDAVDYKTITKKIIAAVKNSDFFLLEKLTDMVLRLVMTNPKVIRASVRVDKPRALRFAKSVSVELHASR